MKYPNSHSLAATAAMTLCPIVAYGQNSESDEYAKEAAKSKPVEEIIVRGLAGRISSTATRTDTPILETPLSVQVLSREILEDQTPRRLRDLYRNVSGVQSDFTGGNVSAKESPIIRGFVDGSVYRNGFRTGPLAPVDFANIERIEVLKGPSSVLFGLAEPGGLLNIVTKQPMKEKFAIVEQEFGSFERFRTTIDANAMLNEEGNLQGRINFAYLDDNTFRNHNGIDRVFVAPSLKWQISSETEFFIDFSYSYQELPFDHGLAFSAEGEPVSDISTFLGEPDFRSEQQEIFASYTLTHRISPNIELRNFTSFQYNKEELNSFRHFGSTNPDNTVNRTVDRSVPKGTVINTVADIGYKFDLGGTRHHVLVGVDGRLEPEFGNQQDGPRARGPFPIDIVDPQFGQFGAIDFNDFSDFDAETKWLGIYVQDQISLLDERLHLLAGARFDAVDQHVKFVAPAFNFDFTGERKDESFSWRFGALYEVTDWLSPYVNVSRSFNPVSPFTIGDLDPTEGFQIEGGVKVSLFGEALIATLAGYGITKDNVPVSDPINPGFSFNGGELKSRGFEIDVTGEILPGWQVIANYALTDTEVVESDFLPIGSRFNNVPKHSGGLWTSYNFQAESPLRGLGLGAGLNGESDKLGNNAGTFELDSYVIADAAIWYEAQLDMGGRPLPVKFQLNVQNVFDKTFFESSSGTASVFPGAPRLFIGSIAVRF